MLKNESYLGDAKHSRVFGLEVEAELWEDPCWERFSGLDNWYIDRDDSLRGLINLEAKVVSPKNRLWYNMNLPLLMDHIFDVGKAKETMRASTHIHINMKGANKIHIANFLCMYYLIEDLLIDTIAGEGRKGNFYCLGLSDAEVGAVVLRDVLNKNMMTRPVEGEVKYSAMNFYTLFKFGTLEFRVLKTKRDCSDVLDCMRLFVRMMKMMSRWEKPTSIIEYMSFNGADRLVKEIVPDKLFSRLTSTQPSYETVMTVQNTFYGVDYGC